jgi:hypothetical protein
MVPMLLQVLGLLPAVQRLGPLCGELAALAAICRATRLSKAIVARVEDVDVASFLLIQTLCLIKFCTCPAATYALLAVWPRGTS